MREPNLSKLAMHSGRRVPPALLVSCLALPLLLAALPGCSGEADASHIGDAATGNTTATAGGPDIFVPGVGGTGNGSGGVGNGMGGAGPYMLPPDYTKASMGGFKLGASRRCWRGRSSRCSRRELGLRDGDLGCGS